METTAHSNSKLPLNTQKDEVLASRALGDPKVFAELYRRHFQRIYRYHMAHTGNIFDAQDLTTQTFMAVLEGLGSYHQTGSFCAWLMGIARRKMAMHFRLRRPELPLELVADMTDPAPLPESIAGLRLEISQISQALRNLTNEQTQAITLCFFADLSAAEAGEVMGKSDAAVKMLILRGLKNLRQKLALVLQEE